MGSVYSEKKPSHSPSHLLRSSLRKMAWLQRRSDRHELVPADKIFLLERLSDHALTSKGNFGKYLKESGSVQSARSRRCRDIFPLPLLASKMQRPPDMQLWRWKILCVFVNIIITALNRLYGTKPAEVCDVPPTLMQLDVHRRCVDRSKDFLDRLEKPSNGDWEYLLPDWVGIPKPAGPQYGDLVAARVDLPPRAALCETTADLPVEWQAVVQDASQMFPDPPPGLASYDSFSSGDRGEYVKLVARQLICGKVGLHTSVKGGGTVLAVGKPNSSRQREVWHGKRVSQAAAEPPKPNHLACPSALIHLEASDEKPIRVSKRDASCWFDQLELPPCLRGYMGRPPVTKRELQDGGGLSMDEIHSFLEEGADCTKDLVYPVSRVWPMGFSWSSFVAQEKLLAICREAGLTEDKVLAADVQTPESFELVFAAATDDTMIFSDAGPGVTAQAASRWDESMAAAGASKNTAKDITDALNATCVGVDLEQGLQLAVPPPRCVALVLTILSILNNAWASPLQVQQALGTLQWYDLLVRSKLSVYEAVYQFAQQVPANRRQRVPANVRDELLLGIMLGVYWLNDLRRPFLPLIGASDASSDFGFGASVARLPEGAARSLARIAEKRGDYVILDGSTADYAQRRLGKPHKLDVNKSDFVHVFSVRKRWPAHINYLEGVAFIMLIRWILRSRRRHGKRVVVLLDSAVWLGAKAKGRSGTMLNQLLRRTAALELAGDLMVYVVLVPSAENPSDEPSRGTRCRKPRKPPLASKRVQKLVDLCEERQRRLKFLFDMETRHMDFDLSEAVSLPELLRSGLRA